jgi:hypothetical protein
MTISERMTSTVRPEFAPTWISVPVQVARCAASRHLHDKGQALRREAAEEFLQGRVVALAVLQDRVGESRALLAQRGQYETSKCAVFPTGVTLLGWCMPGTGRRCV